MDAAHPILAAALQRTEPSLWPGEIHLGAPAPRASYRAVVDLSVVLLELLCELGAGHDVQEAARLCRAVRDADTPAARYSSSRELWDHGLVGDLPGPSQWSELEGEELVTARCFWLVSRDNAPAPPELIDARSDSTVWTIDNIVVVLDTYRIRPNRRAALLRQIDAALLFDEARRLLGAYAKRDDVVEVLWRLPATDAAHLLCEMSTGDYCVLTLLSGQWRAELGPLDDVLSVLPEDLLAAATQRVIEPA